MTRSQNCGSDSLVGARIVRFLVILDRLTLSVGTYFLYLSKHAVCLFARLCL